LLSFWTFGSWGDAEEDEETEMDEEASDEDEESRDLTNGRE
jgi:hypothetical protein